MAPVTLQASCLRAGVNTVDTNDALKRSIDTLQRIYAVVAALAIGEALRRAVLKGGGPAHTIQVSWSDIQLPLCVAVLVTVIPFVHGMNRHLDEHMADLAVPAKRSRMVATLMLDFLIFAIQCCVLFSLRRCCRQPGPYLLQDLPRPPSNRHLLGHSSESFRIAGAGLESHRWAKPRRYHQAGALGSD